MKLDAIENLADLFVKEGLTLFLVGGYVRDTLLGKKDSDIDLASSVTPDEIAALLYGTQFQISKSIKNLGYTQIKHGLITFDHATFRKDFYKNDGGYYPTKIEFIKSIKKDAKRRDFTINSIYQNAKDKKLHYFFGAKRHLKKGLLHTCINPNTSFKQDATRIIRLVRFCLTLNFVPSKKTMQAAIKHKNLLANIPKKVRQKELLKMPKNASETELYKMLLS